MLCQHFLHCSHYAGGLTRFFYQRVVVMFIIVTIFFNLFRMQFPDVRACVVLVLLHLRTLVHACSLTHQSQATQPLLAHVLRGKCIPLGPGSLHDRGAACRRPGLRSGVKRMGPGTAEQRKDGRNLLVGSGVDAEKQTWSS